ncbi:LytTR family DNA-binding domain-containing protein [Hoeflea poritis]|uniref:LytTR family DNA-binding domain-containing protein n=1 Tax=Hoeflea poritis TaxID=2993659 RepID=A0ABT4VR37_9HYPH|nr:LytTR family DNA-binding domain-containing protein [Hoeflea poritis]MDA4847154.1 LytTR family DNA-binding domain-containing protein [Hoeflea poritis]
MNDTVLRETIAEARTVAGRGRFWTGLLGAGFVIGLTGPFGTYDTLPPLARIGYWLVVVSLTFWLGHLVSFAVATWAEDRGLGSPASIGIGAVAASVPVTAFLAGLHATIFAASFWADVLRLFPYVAVIAVGVAAFSEALAAREVTPVHSVPEPAEPAWLDQLPAHLGRNLILLQAQDHYVRAVTDRGETLIRAGMEDAANALGDFGVRIHRSWWVARGAVRAYRYRKGAPVVVLRNGLELPVGRTYRRSARKMLG